ncbi:MAG: hypothetical protein M1478_04540 [Deltaproteobacteria bacterium]|jgi:hypothetical protein|nr:hypothetical protein [Deltaproteobacteria bacterium]MCL5880083.1 hypothetical protein [Deltaproteobacteria bacterium]
MKKLILLLMILTFAITAGIAQKAYADTGQTNITIKQYPQIGVSATIPATFGKIMNKNIIPLVKNEILPFSFLMFLFAMAIRLYLNEEKGYMKEIFYMIFIISILVMYNTIFLWLNSVIEGIAHGIMPTSELRLFLKNIFNWKHPFIDFLALSMGAFASTAALTLASIAVWILEWLRYILLAFLYLIGPITISLSMIPPLRPFLKAWIKDTIEVMSWIIVSAILFQVFNTVLSIGNTYPSLQNLDPMAVAGIYTFLVILIILTPYLTSKLYQGGMGALGSIASYATISMITAGASAGLGAAGVSGGGLAGNIGAKLAGRGGAGAASSTAARHAAASSNTGARHAAEAAGGRKSRPYGRRGSDEE